MRAGTTSVCSIERSPACGRAFGAPERRGINAQKIWEAIQTLFAAKNEVQQSVVSRFGSKTRVTFTTSPTKDEDLRTLNVIDKLILPHSKESKETMSKLYKSVKKMEPGGCLDLTCGVGEHSCEGPSCVLIEPFQKEDLATWFGDITEKEKSEVQIVTEAYMKNTVKKSNSVGSSQGCAACSTWRCWSPSTI